MRLTLSLAAALFLTPALAAAAVWLLGLHGEQAKVVMLLSSMPVAIYTCIIATVFDLDIDLANAMFLITTGVFLVAVLPILVFVM